jgi:hypothetical protein
MKVAIRLITLFAMLSSVMLLPVAALAATTTIDFEEFAEGEVITSVPVGAVAIGVTGSPNPAIIFDATCGGSSATCTGGDDDLFFPGQGNVLIIAENLVDANGDGLIDDPDDADTKGQYVRFDFSALGTVTVESLVVMDAGDDANEFLLFDGQEVGGLIRLFDTSGTLIATVPIPRMGDNEQLTVAVGVAGVASMKVILAGSGAIDDLVITTEDRGNEGCTPGFWKQPQHFDSWVGFSPDQTLESVFDVPDSLGYDNTTLVQALSFQGGPDTAGASRILLRAAVASLLNASSPGVDYPRTTSEVIADVNAALASGDRATMLALASELDADNNLGCPLN